MGCDKLQLLIGGLPLAERVYHALVACCAEVIVVGGSWRPPPGARRVADVRPGRQGPLAGIEAGLAAARCGIVFVAAGDLPFLPRGLVEHSIRRLAEGGYLAVVPRHRGRAHPLCGAYRREVLPNVAGALDSGVRAVREFLGALDRVDYVEGDLRRFGDPDVFLMNVNSPENLERARRLV